MQLAIASNSVLKNDAIGNDVVQEYFSLREHGYDVSIYADNFDGSFSDYMMDFHELRGFVKDEKNVLILHHCCHWDKIDHLLSTPGCKIYLRYHNITPHHFFEGYHDGYVNVTKMGVKQTKEIIRSDRIHHYISASGYNSVELQQFGAPMEKTSALAPFHRIDDFDEIRSDASIAEELLDGRTNVLFVGRIAPNKGHKHLLNVVKEYTELYDRNIRLILVGNLDENLNAYYEELLKMTGDSGLEDIVCLKKNVNFRALHTYYSCSHVFLLMSEHEGFCVPVLEAQYHNLPIIALDRCAVKWTLGEEQILIEKLDYSFFAAAIYTVANDNDIRRYVAKKGMENYRRYDISILSKKLPKMLSDRKKHEFL